MLLLGKEFLSEYSRKVQEKVLKSLKKEVKAEVRLSKTVLPLRGTIIDPSYEYKTGKAIFVVEDPKTLYI